MTQCHFRDREEDRNINKFGGLSQDWVGGKNLFVCFGGFIPYGGEKNHINNILPKIPGQSREHFVTIKAKIIKLLQYATLFFELGSPIL